MERPLVMYHANCVDGFGAAYAIYAHFSQEGSCPCDFVEAVHGQPVPDGAGREVYILDFSCRRQELEDLCRTALSVTVIDQHLTAVRDLADLEKVHDAGSQLLRRDCQRPSGRAGYGTSLCSLLS
jgi:hypothetical protein